MAQHTPTPADPKEIQRAQDMWASFTRVGKWAIIVTVVVMAALGAIFIDWS